MLKSWRIILIGFLLISFSLSAHADGIENDVLKRLLGSGKAVIKPIEDDTLRLTTDKNKLIRLDKDAASVIVNTPEHASVMLDSPRLLIVMPRQPGATSFSVLDAKGSVLLHKEIIVSNVQRNYVRIRRMCTGNDAGCAPTSYFYCPNGCYEVTAVGDTGGAGAPPPPTITSGTAAPTAPNEGGAPGNPVNSTTTPATTPGGGL